LTIFIIIIISFIEIEQWIFREKILHNKEFHLVIDTEQIQNNISRFDNINYNDSDFDIIATGKQLSFLILMKKKHLLSALFHQIHRNNHKQLVFLLS